jgi:hypothetical protein
MARDHLQRSWRTDRHDDRAWSAPLNLDSTVNTSGGEVGPAYVEDEAGLTLLYFTRNSGQGADIFRTQVIDPAGLRRDTNGDGKVRIPASSNRHRPSLLPNSKVLQATHVPPSAWTGSNSSSTPTASCVSRLALT